MIYVAATALFVLEVMFAIQWWKANQFEWHLFTDVWSAITWVFAYVAYVNLPRVCPDGVFPCQSHGEDLADSFRSIFRVPVAIWLLVLVPVWLTLGLHYGSRRLLKRRAERKQPER
jgi:hypothetical protein